VPVAEAGIVEHHVRGQGGQVRGDGPDVQIVHVTHVTVLQQMGAHLIEVDTFRCRFQQHTPGVAQQTPRGLEHQRDHDQRRNRIGPGEAGRQDDDRRDDGADEPV